MGIKNDQPAGHARAAVAGHRRRTLLCVLLTAAVAACAGYRGGWKSVAYVGDIPPARGSDDEGASRPTTLHFPGLQLDIALDNALRTHDTQVVLFALPVSVDPRAVFIKNNQPGKTRLFLTVTPTEAGYVFRPTQAILHVGDQRVGGMAGYEFSMWDAAGQRVQQGGSWQHRPVGDAFTLAQAGHRYLLSIDFDIATPSPETPGLAVDLSAALRSPHHPPLPRIRFAPGRWKEGYT
ncbi:hypothetical protein [Denitromonas sp.]|uniref:hypothetical protein n=1 Tax=Denitromonas sp. TaxID=2734609 RepID=UPI002AFFBDC1|nr:hypothetical protein [Denitromonas sp.]